MYTVKVGDLLAGIERNRLDGICSAANGVGPMGRGIAGAIRKAGGDEIQTDAFRVCCEVNPQEGSAYFTTAGGLKARGIKHIVHAVTMKKPGGYTNINIVRNAFLAAIKLAECIGIRRLGCTALGTGVGGLDVTAVANVMSTVAEDYSMIDLIFIDNDTNFVSALKARLY
jgi:O-acetyl-ADP-ribose deacetylase (regulator of RNase III)